ncbi:MAG: hypothetical protein KatS3mg043_0647 [Rhodothermaceae bacterium]|nr:MAG: hypothetical protein KatS3mg043_0647 [Rhodothermaceae bacterium]
MCALFRLLFPALPLFLLTGIRPDTIPSKQGCPDTPARLAYTFRMDTTSASVFVRGRLETPPCTPLRFRHPARLGPYPLQLITDVSFRDERRELHPVSDGPGTWILQDVHGTLHFSYRVRTDRDAHALPEDNVWQSVMPYADSSRLYLTRYAFLWPEGIPLHPAISLTWDVPEEWTVVTPWSSDRRSVEAPGLYALLKNYFVAFRTGDVQTRRIGQTNVTLAWTGPGTLAEPVANQMMQVIRTVLDLEPGGFGTHLTFLLHDTSRRGIMTGGTAGASSIQLQFPHGLPLTRMWPYAGEHILRIMAHELIHTWTYAREQALPHPAPLPVEWDTPMCWMREGVTEYLAHLALLDAGLLTPEALSRNLQRMTRLARGQDPEGAWTLQDACEQYYDNPAAFYYTYYEGMRFAFYLDMALRQHSNGHKTLRGFMQVFIPLHRGVEKSLPRFRSAWQAYAPAPIDSVEGLLARQGNTDLTPYLRAPFALPAPESTPEQP